MPRRFTHVMAVTILLWANQSAEAWNSAGHRIIANVSYDLLDADTRAKVVDLIKASPRFPPEFTNRMPASVKGESDAIKDRWHFLQSSIWADLIRGNDEYSIEKWHYINKPYFLTDLDAKALASKSGIPQITSLPDKIDPKADPADLNAVQALKLCLARISSPDTPKEKKGTYVLWVMHIVGDLHQPLHSTSLYSRARFQKPGGDRGGNSIKVKQAGNLHSLWDGLLGGSGASLNEVRGRAEKLVKDARLKKNGEDSARALDPSIWVDEGHAICKESVYCKMILDEVQSKEASPGTALAPVDLSEEYLTKAGEIARERAVQGAYRLAAILKKTIK